MSSFMVLVAIIAFLYVVSKAYFDRTMIPMEQGNRMVRIGSGQHNYCWYFRIDLWYRGYRWTLK